MPGIDNDIHVLNSLIKTTLDSRKGFQDAAEDAENTHFASFFSDFAQRRAVSVLWRPPCARRA